MREPLGEIRSARTAWFGPLCAAQGSSFPVLETAASRLRWALPIGVELSAEEHAGAHRHD